MESYFVRREALGEFGAVNALSKNKRRDIYTAA